MTTIQEQLVSSLTDAHALEQHVDAVLASALRMTDVPELRGPLEHHKQETERHLALLEERLRERVAERAGDGDTAEVARRNRADEQAMAAKIASLWDLAVDLSLKEEGVQGAPPIPPPSGSGS